MCEGMAILFLIPSQLYEPSCLLNRLTNLRRNKAVLAVVLVAILATVLPGTAVS
jgi:hypothetical protein